MIDWGANLANAEALCRVAAEAYGRGWVPATSGNFSFRERASGRVFITASGLDKGALAPQDLIEIDSEGRVLAGRGKPSAETMLHLVIYKRFPEVGAIVHTHSVWNCLAGERAKDAVELEGYELLKALSGVSSHEHLERVPVLENSQDYAALSAELDRVLTAEPAAHAILLRRHGMYAWGESVAGARRHLEALEWLFEARVRGGI